jgi:hypothetical protein
MSKKIIYKVTLNLTDQVYIGATSKSIDARKQDHVQKSKKGLGSYFQSAVATYGPEAFSWEQIDTANDVNEMASKEKRYILEYNSKKSGFNSDQGGGVQKTVYKYDLVTKELINQFDSLTYAAKTVNTTKQHISRACLSVNKTFKGFFWSYDYFEYFEPEKDSRIREVQQFSLVGGLLAEYKSVAEASRQTGISKTCISRVCRCERQQSAGYLWKFK